jgi:hypothetical protein
MEPYRWIATFVLETLVMKVAGLDDDGLDLVFTIGEDDLNASNVYPLNAPSIFKAKMDKAWERPHSDRYKTDMKQTLSKLFERYYRDSRKCMTLIVLTDGVWPGTIPEDGVETSFVDFIQELRKSTGYSAQSRRFTIQFVRFGDNQDAIEKLTRLDNDLKRVYFKLKFP